MQIRWFAIALAIFESLGPSLSSDPVKHKWTKNNTKIMHTNKRVSFKQTYFFLFLTCKINIGNCQKCCELEI